MNVVAHGGVAVRRIWDGPLSGPALRAVLVAVSLPIIITAFAGSNPPLGVYLNGVIVGSLYGLVAVGLVLIWRANRIINFAQASLGALPAVAGVLLIVQRDFPYVAVVPMVIAGSLLVGALVEFVFIRRFAQSPRLILTLATIGIAQFLVFFELILPEWIGGRRLPRVILETPFSEHARTIGGVRFTLDHLVTAVLVLVLTVALASFFRYTRTGKAVRASAENSDRAALLGVPVKRVSTIVWMIAALLSAVGVFQHTAVTSTLTIGLAGTLPIGVGTATLLYALVPAVIARMESIPIALGAGVAMGVIDQTVFYTTRNATIARAFILPLLLVALLVQRARLGRAEDTGIATWRQVKEFRPIPTELRGLREVKVVQWVLRAVVVGLVVALPYLAGPGRQDVASLLIIYAITGVSLVILTGWGGQISLGHFAFAGIGAAVAGGLVANHGFNFVVALVLAGLAGSAISVVIGIPAVRLPGLFLAATTLAFAANTQYFFLQRQYFDWLLPDAESYVERPVLFGRLDLRSDHAFYFTCVVVLVLAVAVARSIRSQRSGRVMIAVRDNSRAAQSFGINPTRTRLAAFAFSGFFAALAGALFAHVQGVVDPDVFTPDRSLQIFAMAVIGGLTSVGGALAGALYVVGFQYYLPRYSLLASGSGMLLLLLFFRGGLSELGFTLRDAYLRRLATRKRIHVPSLVADSRQGAFDLRAEEEEIVAAATEGVEAAVEEPVPVGPRS
jgi:branched-chain amino acid transport system permease protein